MPKVPVAGAGDARRTESPPRPEQVGTSDKMSTAPPDARLWTKCFGSLVRANAFARRNGLRRGQGCAGSDLAQEEWLIHIAFSCAAAWKFPKTFHPDIRQDQRPF